MDNQARIEKMSGLLQDAFAPNHLNIIDDSHLHAGHAGARSGAGHFTLEIASQAFEGKGRVACHQMIYQCLDDMMGPDIHALSIKIK